MRATLRVHSLLGLAVFIGWSVLAHARERVTTPPVQPTAKTVPPRPSPPVVHAPATDPRLWN